MDAERAPFSDLPAALVNELIERAGDAGGVLLNTLQELRAERARLRQALLDRGLIMHESQLGYSPIPTTCGADGSYAIDRLLSADLAVAAAVAVEGLTPPSETRHWEQPHHVVQFEVEVHHADTATVLRAVMLGNELELAVRAPHDVVMLDMTLTLPIIYFNQALNQAPQSSALRCSQVFLDRCANFLEDYLTILRSQRSDKQYVGLPKYSTRREIGNMMGWTGESDDRAILSVLLQPGELTRPIRLEQPDQAWHLNTEGVGARIPEALPQAITNALEHVHVIYYKPHEWLPALRVEVAYNVAQNQHRLATVIQGLKYQCAAPGMFEPYPVYLADRTVKALTKALPALRQIAAQHVAEQYNGDFGEVYYALHGYRSEIGR